MTVRAIHLLMRFGAVAIVTASLASAAGAAQRVQEIEPGVRYTGEVRLQAAEYGVSFVLPQGWAGGLPEGFDFFVMESPSFQAYVLAGIEELTLVEAQRLMAGEIDLGDGAVMHPAGDVTTQGVLLEADYTVSGTPDPLRGRVTTIIGDHGYGVFFIAAAAADDFESVRSAVERMSASVSLVAPVAAPAPPPGSWQQQLAGRKLSYFFTRSGYTEEEYLWLCPDGRFFRSMNSGGFGGGASGAFQSQNGGRWEASGNAQSGILSLSYNDGASATYALSIEDDKLFLDGSRYFREVTDCG